MSRQGWPANSKDIYTHNAAMFSSKCETFALQVAYALVAELFSKLRGTKARQKTIKFLWFELATVTSQALKYDVIHICQQCLSNFIQNLISPQRPLSIQHPSYHTLRWIERVNVSSCSYSKQTLAFVVNVWLPCPCHVVAHAILQSLIVPLCSPRGCCVVLAVS